MAQARTRLVPTADMISCELIPAPRPLDQLRSDWDSLFRRVAREPAVCFEWSSAICRNHLADSQDWFVAVLRRGSDIEGIVPMMLVKERLLGMTVTTLQPVCEKNNTHSDLLLSEYSDELLDAWLDALTHLRDRWDLLRISRLLENGELAQQLQRAMLRRQAASRLRLEQPSYHLTLAATYPEYLAQRSGKFRNYLKRAEKRFGALGDVAFSRVLRAEDPAERYAELLSIEQDSWKHQHGTAISAVAHQTGFYRDLIGQSLESGILHLTFLRLNGVAVAYNLGILVNGCYSYLKTSFRESLRAHGVASIGRARLIEQLIGEGVRELDFPAEPYEWEKQWTHDLRWHRSLLMYNATLLGNTLRFANAARDLWRRPVEDRRVIHSDSRALQAPDA